ncbi:MAG: hypothetical protein WCI54_08540 [Bacteroidia bacterium]
MKNKKQDQLFAELLRNDQVGEPDQTIEKRLEYSFLLKNSSSKLRQNSFGNFFGWIFSVQSIGLKAGLVSLALTFFVMNSQLNLEPGKIGENDSISAQRILLADSTHLIQPIDSICKDSLY